MVARRWPWAGLFGGAFFWYAAHDLGLYFSAVNCRHQWIVAAVHIVAMLGAALSGLVSWEARPDDGTGGRRLTFSAGIGLGAAALFMIVILWQGAAGFIYSGCER
jgi:hypothetical protein